MTVDLYDFDKTVFPVDSSTAFWLFCMKRHPKIIKHLPRQILGAIKFFLKKINLTQFKEEFFSFLKSVDGEKEAALFWEKNGDRIFEWFKPTENDAVTVVCSASPEFEIRPILEKLGVQIILGTRVNPKTGKITGENCKREEKVRRIKEVVGDCEFRNAFTDNPESDAPLLSLAENKFVVIDKKPVKQN